MIIIGYQGIGKSTISGVNNCIDLESGMFYNNGKRPDNWFVYYCNIADDLSKQGYTVFVSSHAVVRQRLRKYSNEAIYAIIPSVSLKDAWIEKLKDRFENSRLEKDMKAYLNAKDRYEYNLAEIRNDCNNVYVIKDMNYNLNDIVNEINNKSFS